MNITDELRAYVRGHSWKSLTAIADRIDAEHEKRITSVMNDALYHANEKDMADLGWYRVLDADKQPIHIGDRMEHIELGYVCEVIAVGADCFIAWNTHLNRYCQYDSTLFRHYKPPTVEDVLREFTDAILDWAKKSGTVAETGTWSDVAAEYAAKLQLRSDQ